MRPDPIELELWRHRFAGAAEEMGVTLRRAAFSPNIKERLDFSCAVFDGDGRTIAQAAHIPVHLGAMPRSVEAALAATEDWRPGDVVVLNDPYEGGSHLPDITMVAPVFLDEGAVPGLFVAARAHHADVGGMSPGSLPLARELCQEGLVIPPVKLWRAGALDPSLMALILRNVRTPDERRGDLVAQRAALLVGARRLSELAASCRAQGGAERLARYAAHLLDYSERLTRAAIAAWPDGVYRFDDQLAWCGPDDVSGGAGAATIAVAVRVEGDRVTFDFAGTAPQVTGPVNAVLAVTESACRYVVLCLVGDDVPPNEGCFAPVRVTAPPGCLVNATPPAAVSAGNVETSQRVTDVALGALAQALPSRVPAASQGTMNNLTIGGRAPDGTPFAYYETIAGGAGAGPDGPGAAGVHTHMTNTLNTPVEALEQSYPMRIRRYGLRPDSGGAGRHPGGDGVVREYELLVPASVTLISTRRDTRPWGLAGGQPGAPGRNAVVYPDGRRETLPGQFSRHLPAGARLIVETPGGGGWGERG